MALYRNATFNSFEDFEEALRTYNLANGVEFVKKSGHSVEWANNRAAEGLKPFEPQLKYKDVQYECKFGKIRKSESTGIRVNQRSMKLGCPARFCLNAERGNPQHLRVSQFLGEHKGHPCDNEFAKFIPSRRRLCADELEKVEEMIDVRGQPMAIRQHIRATTHKALTAKDLQNLRRDIKKKHLKGNTEVQDALGELENLLKNDEGAYTSVAYSEEDNVIDCLYFQTSKMRQLVEKYPELIGMDTTYKINKNNMHLVVTQVIDNHGNGRVVGYCFIRGETGDIVEEAISQFTEANKSVVDKIQTVLVDKDYREIKAIKKYLPNARVHLCHTHVMRQFRRHTVSEKNKKTLRKILLKMSECGSKEEFDKYYNQVKEQASPQFLKYFDENWKDCNEAWILYVRNASLSLGVRSNNYVESHNSKIKSVTDRVKTLGECIRGLLLLYNHREFESDYKDFREIATRSYIANCEDEDVADIMQVVCDWPAKLLYKEWQQIKDVREDEVEETQMASCTCQFYVTFGMKHCRHIFKRRQTEGVPLLAKGSIPERWLKPYEDFRGEVTGTAESAACNENVIHVLPRTTPLGPKPMTESQRYNSALKLTTHIASLISLTGGQQYENRIKNLKDLISTWESRKEAVVLPTTEAQGNITDNIDMGSTSAVDLPSVIHQELPESGNSSSRSPPQHDGHKGEDLEKSAVQSPQQEQIEQSQDLSANSESLVSHEERRCFKCHQEMTRQVTKRDTKGNKGRYHWACSRRCSFRWDSCPKCESNNVRVGHNCTATLTAENGDQDRSRGDSHRADAADGRSPITDETGKDRTETPFHEPLLTSEVQSPGSEISDFVCNFDLGDLEDLFDDNNSQSRPLDSPWRETEQCFTNCYSEQEEANDGSIAEVSDSLNSGESNKSTGWTRSEDRVAQESVDLRSNIIEDNLSRTRYEKGMAIANEDVSKCDLGWRVKSQTSSGDHIVTRKTQHCKLLKCSAKPHPCMHRYVCTCFDNHNPCKHIYKVHSIDAPGEVAKLNFPSNSKDGTSERRTAQKMSLTDFQTLKTNLLLPPAQKVDGKPSRHINKKQKPAKERKKKNEGKPNNNGDLHEENEDLDSPDEICEIDSDKENNEEVNSPSSLSTTSSSPENTSKGFERGEELDFPTINALYKYDFQGYSLTKFEFDSMMECRDLHDHVIDGFMSLSIKRALTTNMWASLHVIESQLLESISYLGKDSLMTGVSNEASFFKDLWLVPTHINRSHWVLFLVFIRRKMILVLEPLFRKKELPENIIMHLQILRSILAESHELCLNEAINWDEWVIHAPKDLQNQKNSTDCGLFVCVWAHILATQKNISKDILNDSIQLRKWISSVVHSNCTGRPYRLDESIRLQPQSGNLQPKEFISETYKEIDEQQARGQQAVERPWMALPVPNIRYEPPDQRRTENFLMASMTELWRATEKKCGAPNGCRVTHKPRMFQCEACREWYHLDCVGDLRGKSKKLPDSGYLCPLHAKGKTRTRVYQRPIRHRKSL